MGGAANGGSEARAGAASDGCDWSGFGEACDGSASVALPGTNTCCDRDCSKVRTGDQMTSLRWCSEDRVVEQKHNKQVRSKSKQARNPPSTPPTRKQKKKQWWRFWEEDLHQLDSDVTSLLTEPQ